MNDNALGWDLEIAEELPLDSPFDPVASPMGISCAAVANDNDAQLFHGATALYQEPMLFSVGNCMLIQECRDMADALYAYQRKGKRIVTWNGLGFDFPILAQSCQSTDYARLVAEIALAHTDVAYAMLCDRGYMISLQSAATGLRLQGKLENMTGALAPVIWNGVGRELTPDEHLTLSKLGITPGTVEARQLCLDYVEQDARTTYAVYDRLMYEQALTWITRAGTWARQPWIPSLINRGLGTCADMHSLPLPDTSWMTGEPRTRESCIGWALDLLN